MNIPKLNEAIEMLKDNLGSALLGTDIYATADGQSIAGYLSVPQACALFNQVTQYLHKTLSTSGFPGLGRYYLVDLQGGNMVIILPFEKYQWGMMVDTKKTQLGLILNVIIPQITETFHQAMA